MSANIGQAVPTSNQLLDDAKVIGEPITFSNGVTAPNRFLKSAMTERLCTWHDTDLEERGKPTPEYLRLYEEWGKGECGTIVLGNLPVDARYPEAAGNPILDYTQKWNHVEAFKPIIAATKAHGSLCIGQITHAGRQTNEKLAPHPPAPSAIACKGFGGMTFGVPVPMTTEQIHDLIKRFGYAAKVLYEAGADGAQLHCAHGYLLSQFLSPRANHRTDEWGGSLENRARIHREIAKEIRRQVPDEKFMLQIKINSHDFIEGGMEEDESRTMCKWLEEWGFTCIELSGGTYEALAFVHKKDSTLRREAFFIEFAERIRPNLKTAKLCVTGGFRSASAMASAIRDGATDMIGLGRPMTAETDVCGLLIAAKQPRSKISHCNEGMSTSASYLQIGEIGSGLEPSDFSDPQVAQLVDEAIMRDFASTFSFRPQPVGGVKLPRPEELKALPIKA